LVTTLSEATLQTISKNPNLKSLHLKIRAAQGSFSQSGLLPNPELELEVEEFGGSRDGFNQAESTVALSQPIELGGKRSARMAVASKVAEKTELQANILALEVLSSAEIAFANVQRAQAVQEATKEQAKLSDKVISIANKKLKAGAILPIEKTRALIARQNDNIALHAAESALANAKLSLAVFWNGDATEVGTLSKASLPTGIDGYFDITNLDKSPYMRLIELEHQIAKNELELERALAVPDVSLGLGYRRFEETNENTFLGTFTIELPIFDRNQGSIERASYTARYKESAKANSSKIFKANFEKLQNELNQLADQYQILVSEILPLAKQAFREAEQAYQQGRTSYLELLDARETLFESQLNKEQFLFEILETHSKIRMFSGEMSAQISQAIDGVEK
jgi:cobalt-zinc-cadmium efflux system outer membrane protein